MFGNHSYTYQRYWDKWETWRKANDLADNHTPTPREFAAFLHHERYENEYSSNTMWCIASAVNKRLDYYFHTAPIKSEFVKKLLKNWSKKEVTRKAKHFSREEIFRFLKDTPDTGDWLQKKAQVIVAVYGGFAFLSSPTSWTGIFKMPPSACSASTFLSQRQTRLVKGTVLLWQGRHLVRRPAATPS